MDSVIELIRTIVPLLLAIIAYYTTDKIKRDKEKSKSKVYEWKEMYEQQKKIIELNETKVNELTQENEKLRKQLNNQNKGE